MRGAGLLRLRALPPTPPGPLQRYRLVLPVPGRADDPIHLSIPFLQRGEVPRGHRARVVQGVGDALRVDGRGAPLGIHACLLRIIHGPCEVITHCTVAVVEDPWRTLRVERVRFSSPKNSSRLVLPRRRVARPRVGEGGCS